MQTIKDVISWLSTKPQDEPVLIVGLWTVDDVIEESGIFDENEEPILNRQQAIEAMEKAECVDEYLCNEEVCEIIADMSIDIRDAD